LGGPYWLQDALTGDCLGPFGGFSECGEVTTWAILDAATALRSSNNKSRVSSTIRRSNETTYALQLAIHTKTLNYSSVLDGHEMQTLSSGRWEDDCLNEHPGVGDQTTSALELGPCSFEHSFIFSITETGFLNIDSLPLQKRVWRIGKGSSKRRRQCLERNVTTSSVLVKPCSSNIDDGTRQVQITLVQPTVETIKSRLVRNVLKPAANDQVVVPRMDRKRGSQVVGTNDKKNGSSQSSDVSQVRAIIHLSGSGAVASHKHSLYRDDQRPSSISLSGSSSCASSTKQQVSSQSRKIDFLRNTNPILLAGGDEEDALSLKPSSNKEQRLARPVGLHKTMRKHPYIEVSQNGMWEDPQTGLRYHTDLCEYLGHTRKESGRHTLTGVGLYTRTMLKIKIYGVAFYVSKRDVLADPKMKPFASMEAEDLRLNPEFYSILRRMESQHADGGAFDRTLFVKTNMQLGTDTMRSSLESGKSHDRQNVHL
jgi:N6-adenosine-specific RNA methylase IME4